MHIFEFLRLLQSAIATGLFVRVTTGKNGEMRRYRPASRRAMRILFPDWFADGEPACDIEDICFCPITLVGAWLGYGWAATEDYVNMADKLHLDGHVHEAIVHAADMRLPDDDGLYREGQLIHREVLDAACTTPPPPPWS